MINLVNFGRALSDPTRVRILNALRQSELCVCELVDALEVNGSTLSTHLQTLRNTGVVTTEKRRAWVIYSISESAAPAIEAAFENFPTINSRIERDLDRLSRRMLLRVEGCCVAGARQLEQEAMLV
ncbi:MAG: winged helix-turn-helix transcriptional regulator [Chthonomonadaceae bacterium]|nr:winged helix-turn-helix transcriptional regulator [Chthonomonadaceae bacterium]